MTPHYYTAIEQALLFYADNLEQENIQLRKDLTTAIISPWFGCLTRPGLNLALKGINTTDLAIIYIDIDKMKRANELYGKIGAGDRVRDPIMLRQGETIAFGQWFSGDEFIAFISMKDAYGCANRLLKDLQRRDMSATFVIRNIDKCTYEQLVSKGGIIDQTDEYCAKVKDSGMRGCIVKYNDKLVFTKYSRKVEKLCMIITTMIRGMMDMMRAKIMKMLRP